MFEKKENEVIKKEKKKREHNNGKEKRIINIAKAIIIPILFAGIITIVIFMALENKAKGTQMKKSVVVMKDDISANTIISKDDLSSYFKEIMIDASIIPDSAYHSIKDLPEEGFCIKSKMDKSQMVLENDIKIEDGVLEKYKKGYELTSFSADAFDGSVNGSIRRGDIVDVYALDPATEVLTLMLEDVYIAEAYDSSGKKICESDEIATSFTVYVTKDEVKKMNMAVVYGKIQMYLII